jgi:2-polyprenyl-6-methoxyphenol hydroxylase-like FAD-dependent oxidoreductase
MKVLICGAGIAGLAMAGSLDRAGTEVVTLEQAPGPRTQGYMIDFFGPGYDAAEALGVLPRIRAVGYDVREASYRDREGRRRAGLPFDRFARVMDGRLVSIMRPDLERALRESLSNRVDQRFGARLSGVEQRSSGVRVTLADGGRLDADVLVGADGIHSAVRAAAFGAETGRLRYLGLHTSAYVFRDDAVYAEVRDEFALTDSIDRLMGFYGLRDGSVAVFTVHRTTDPGIPTDTRATILREYDSLGWLAPRALAACPPADRIYYDQVAQIEMPRWSRGRVVLVGDACGAVSLLAGQGASLGIAGAHLLATELAGSSDVEAAFARYEERMRPLVTERQRTARNGVRWFLPHTRRDLTVRRTMLKLAGLPGVDRLVARSIAGKPAALLDALPTNDRARRSRSLTPPGPA